MVAKFARAKFEFRRNGEKENGQGEWGGTDSVSRLIYKLAVFTRANRGLFAILQLNNRT